MIKLSQFLSIIVDGILKKKISVIVPLSNYILNVLWILYKSGYICGYKVVNKTVEVHLKYISENSVFGVIKQISSISKRIYITKNVLQNKNSFGTLYVISSSFGIRVITKELVNNCKKFGGEVLFKIK